MKTPLTIVTTLALLAGLAACGANSNYTPGGPQVGKCGPTCKNDPDTLTLEAVWLAPEAGAVDGHVGTVSWTKSAATQYSGSQPIGAGTQWQAFEHGWADEGFPTVTLAVGETGARGFLTCRLWYTPKGSQTPIIVDFVQRGEKVPGNIGCTTAIWLKAHPGGKL